MTDGHEITRVWVVLGTDDQGEESIASVSLNGTAPVPMVSTEWGMPTMRRLAVQMVLESKRPLQLVCFERSAAVDEELLLPVRPAAPKP